MTALTYAVPLAAVRHGADFAGNLALVQLVADRAELRPDAIVELGVKGWFATVTYTPPGQPTRLLVAHIGLLWAPQLQPQEEEARHAQQQ